VKVKVLFFASLREQLGVSSEEVELPKGVATVGELRAFLARKNALWEKTLATHASLRAAVNQDMAQPTMRLKAGDEVAFFPPVTGG